MKMNISKLTYDNVKKVLGTDSFYMHFDASDCLKNISNSSEFESLKKHIINTYGDIEVALNPDEEWFNQVKYMDEDFINDSNEYIKRALDKINKWTSQSNSEI